MAKAKLERDRGLELRAGALRSVEQAAAESVALKESPCGCFVNSEKLTIGLWYLFLV